MGLLSVSLRVVCVIIKKDSFFKLRNIIFSISVYCTLSYLIGKKVAEVMVTRRLQREPFAFQCSLTVYSFYFPRMKNWTYDANRENIIYLQTVEFWRPIEFRVSARAICVPSVISYVTLICNWFHYTWLHSLISDVWYNRRKMQTSNKFAWFAGLFKNMQISPYRKNFLLLSPIYVAHDVTKINR